MRVRQIVAFLRELGVTGATEQRVARDVLEARQFTRPGRRNMARYKEGAAREAIIARLALHCGNESCRIAMAARAGDRSLLLVERSSCEICQGSVNRSSLEQAGQAMATAGMSRIMVVGGMLPLHTEIPAASPPTLQWRFVDGTRRVDGKMAASHIAWADVVVVWAAATPLAHTVSHQYSAHPKAIVVSRRGIAALADAVTRFATKHQEHQ